MLLAEVCTRISVKFVTYALGILSEVVPIVMLVYISTGQKEQINIRLKTGQDYKRLLVFFALET
jgi:hypothetical protein